MAFHFGAVSLASLPANLLALPAVAPVMWLGMAAAILGQLPGIPTAPLGALAGPLLDYIALVARLLAAPDWGVVEPPAPTPAGLVTIYAALLAGAGATLRLLRRRQGLGLRGGLRRALGALALLVGAVDGAADAGAPAPARRPERLRITAIDVGQGDAILLQQGRRAGGARRHRPAGGGAGGLAAAARGRSAGRGVPHPRPARPRRRP